MNNAQDGDYACMRGMHRVVESAPPRSQLGAAHLAGHVGDRAHEALAQDGDRPCRLSPNAITAWQLSPGPPLHALSALTPLAIALTTILISHVA